ncbi:MAG: hypothetical protein A3C16_02920 [Candidatus Sungbacteria bacterium RIFCSPHIGHO2_02_FULL_51_29]|uniref:Uncharacterized protein n=1 Tax=Candidatus Sungbacteria bacterium RIFCSPHIGHO2_02_FULL_51_29 TaxID=1802273 RepID=A0A1G2KWR0_9BACT|nr:MAG: hypothetical protein A3C16_02920 [Candidatus Sungbacteria bacterium RIFCSPHIGHO2_02_FULL_51_29]
MLLLLPPSVFLGYLAYERWIGPLLRKRGWNEKSFWRGMQLMVISVLFFETVIAVMLFALSLVLR